MRSMAPVIVALAANGALAAQHFVPTQSLLVRNPSSGARKVIWKVRDLGSTPIAVGDPTVHGATLRVALTPGGDFPFQGWRSPCPSVP